MSTRTTQDETEQRTADQASLDDIRRTAEGRDRDRMINDFFARKIDAFRSVARRLCRDRHLPAPEHLDDVAQIVAAEAYRMVDLILAGGLDLDTLHSFDGMLYRRCANAVRTYESGGAGRLSGASSLIRRRRSLAAVAAELRARDGREPNLATVVEVHNERMRATRRDPARQGMIATLEDFATDPMPLAHDLTSPDPSASPVARRTTTDEHEPDLTELEARSMLDRVHKVAARTDQTLADVVMSWLGGVFDPEVGEPRTAGQVATHLDLPMTTVRTLIADAQRLCVQVATTEYGLTGERQTAT